MIPLSASHMAEKFDDNVRKSLGNKEGDAHGHVSVQRESKRL
jgi:hypothetical protein